MPSSSESTPTSCSLASSLWPHPLVIIAASDSPIVPLHVATSVRPASSRTTVAACDRVEAPGPAMCLSCPFVAGSNSSIAFSCILSSARPTPFVWAGVFLDVGPLSTSTAMPEASASIFSGDAERVNSADAAATVADGKETARPDSLISLLWPLASAPKTRLAPEHDPPSTVRASSLSIA
eukprot:scaffold264497_cov28-Tisochrysis_lutea.AAC.3